jgi:hypothetical protein
MKKSTAKEVLENVFRGVDFSENVSPAQVKGGLMTREQRQWLSFPKAVLAFELMTRAEKRCPFLWGYYQEMKAKHPTGEKLIEAAACLSLIDNGFHLRQLPFPSSLIESRWDAATYFRLTDTEEATGISFGRYFENFGTWEKRFFLPEDKEKWSLLDRLLEDFGKAFFSRLSELLANKDMEGTLSHVNETKHYHSRLTLIALEGRLEEWRKTAPDTDLSRFAVASLEEVFSGDSAGGAMRVFLEKLMGKIEDVLPEAEKASFALVKKIFLEV